MGHRLIKIRRTTKVLFRFRCVRHCKYAELFRFIARRLELADVDFKKADYTEEIKLFTRERIKMDGVFVLRMLTIHTGIMVCSEVIDAMWDQFLIEEGTNIIISMSSCKIYFRQMWNCGKIIRKRGKTIWKPIAGHNV
jgi:hypothetical protein